MTLRNIEQRLRYLTFSLPMRKAKIPTTQGVTSLAAHDMTPTEEITFVIEVISRLEAELERRIPEGDRDCVSKTLETLRAMRTQLILDPKKRP